ncbi:hypothetical protein NMW79_05070 [Pasteurella multocida]|nr:hypothetical protein [Pasteurella multocida]
MSNSANWAYTAQATIWHKIGDNYETGEAEFSEPVLIYCDYGHDGKLATSSLGREAVAKNTIWTEYDKAKKGDYILIGQSNEVDPFTANANEIISIIRYADTFDRKRDDFVLMTG